jgi:hypothetical protein
MGILLAFAPFIVFFLLDRLVGPLPGLIAATLVSAAFLVRDTLSRDRTVKVLEIGTVILFGGLAAYTLLTHAVWSVFGVRLCVDAGLLLVVLVSMAIRQPFTLQYARQTTPREVWDSPEFVRTNYIITAAWAAAFAILVIADLVMVYVPGVPPRVGVILTVVALIGAVKFTSWYPEHRRAQIAGPKT